MDDGRNKAHELKEIATAILNEKDYEDAIPLLNQLTTLTPFDAWPWENLGRAYFELDQFENSVSANRQALQRNRGNARTWSSLGAALRMSDKTNEAITALSEAIRLEPGLAAAHGQRGASYRMQGWHSYAITDCMKAVELGLKTPWIYWNIGNAYYLSKNFPEAMRYCKEALAIDPQHALSVKDLKASQKALGIYQEPHIYPSAPAPTRFIAPAVSPQATQNFTFSAAKPPPSVESRSVPSAPTWSMCFESPIELNADPMAIPRKELIFMQEIGDGGFGIVYQGEWVQTGLRKKPVAIKQLKLNILSEKTLADFKREVEIQSKLDSPAVVKLYGITGEEANKPYCMVMEFMELGALRNTLMKTEPAQFGWDIRLQIAKDIATGLVYLHGQNPMIVHGDIKSLNILLNNQYRAKIADFGLASLRTEISSRYYVQSSPGANKAKGSVLWVAPELFKMNAKRTRECDMFSYAVVLWEMASLKLPYMGAEGNESLIKSWVIDGERESFDDETTPNTPEEYKAVVEQCWQQNPRERLTAAAALETLERIQLYGQNPTVRVMFPAQGGANNSNNVPVIPLPQLQRKY